MILTPKRKLVSGTDNNTLNISQTNTQSIEQIEQTVLDESAQIAKAMAIKWAIILGAK